MPRYFFDVFDGKAMHRDRIGDEFATVDEAKAQAQAILPDLARDATPNGELHVVTCDVRDENGRVVYQGEMIFRQRLTGS